MQNYKATVEAQLEAQRAACEMNSRPQANQKDIVNTWAKDLINALEAGDKAEATRIALALRPFVSMLREGN